jgi:hypothetical protein
MAGAETDQDVEALRAEYLAKSVRALKELLKALNIEVPGTVLEKRELVELLLTATSGDAGESYPVRRPLDGMCACIYEST